MYLGTEEKRPWEQAHVLGAAGLSTAPTLCSSFHEDGGFSTALGSGAWGHTSEQAKGQKGLVTRGVQTGALRCEWVALWLLEFWGHLPGTPALPQEHARGVQAPTSL